MSYGAYQPYGNINNDAPTQQGYGQNPYAQDLEQGNNYEMQQPQAADQMALLDQCKRISNGIQEVKKKREDFLAGAQNAMLSAVAREETEQSRQLLANIEGEIYHDIYALKEALQKLKNTRGSDSVSTQIRVTGNNLNKEIEAFQKSQSEYNNKLKADVRRQYANAHPEATHEEIEQGTENVIAGTQQVFQISGARTQMANDTRNAVQQRSAAIRKIEQDLIELSRLTTEINEIVQQQEPAVEQINRGAENVAQDLQNANTQLGQAVESARKARRWKWYALIIIIIIIAIIVGVAVGVTQSRP